MSLDRNSNSQRSRRRELGGLLLLCGLACNAAQAITTAPQLPAGTELHIRLTDPVSSTTSKVGQTVHAVLIEPVLSGETIALAAGTTLTGSVTQVRHADDQSHALLGFDFKSVTLPNKRVLPVALKLKQVDDARETVDDDGNIVGIEASKTLTSEADKGINKLSQNYSGLASILETVKSAVVKPADPAITYAAGVEMTLTLVQPLTVTGPPAVGPALQPLPEKDLLALVARQPVRAYAVKPVLASDLTNILLIGTEEELRQAFDLAGWSIAASLNGASKLETVRAVMEDRGYKEGPVSVLTIGDQPPDFVFQKANNTFASRHHLRIWRRPEVYAGLPVWLVTATHDTGIGFSERDRTFTHKIDPHIDAERSKVVNDLLFTGMVRSLGLVTRLNLPLNPMNATGDQLLTDGRMAVLMLQPAPATGGR